MPPRRTTLTYSSEDAPQVAQEQVLVYYCKHSGKHALTTNCDLRKAPKRRADGASVIDLDRFTVKLYTSDGGVILIRRPDGTVERQYRLNMGKLPVAYKPDPDGKLLYILDGALTTYAMHDQAPGTLPVPPCIFALDGDTVQATLDIEDRGPRPQIIKISADSVRLQIASAISSEGANEELLEYIRSVLGVTLRQLSLTRGDNARQKLLLVTGATPAEVFDKLQFAWHGPRAKAGS